MSVLVVYTVSGIFIKTRGHVTTIILFKFEARDAHIPKILSVYYIGADVLPEGSKLEPSSSYRSKPVSDVILMSQINYQVLSK